MLRIRNSEWDVLCKNLVNSGLSYGNAGDIIKKHKEILKDFREKLEIKINKGKITENDADEKFKNEFWKICQKLE